MLRFGGASCGPICFASMSGPSSTARRRNRPPWDGLNAASVSMRSIAQIILRASSHRSSTHVSIASSITTASLRAVVSAVNRANRAAAPADDEKAERTWAP